MMGIVYQWYAQALACPSSSIVLDIGLQYSSVPQLGYGTGTAWYKAGDDGKIDRATVDAVKLAIKLGYYHLDGAEGLSYRPRATVLLRFSVTPVRIPIYICAGLLN